MRFCWIVLALFFMSVDHAVLASSELITTDQATLFLSTYEQEPVQDWPKHLPNESDIPSGPQGELIRQGIRLLTQTSKWVGPKTSNPSNRLSQNNLNCVQCHVEGLSGLPGTRPGQLPYMNVVHDYPKLDVKTMKMISLQDRIRGMFGGGNGRLTDESQSMKAMMAYFNWLGTYSKSGSHMKGTYLKQLSAPKTAANPVAGKRLYTKKCSSCHGDLGLGIQALDFENGGGYVIPPVAGNDTYTDGGHMYAVPVLARFIYGYMPKGATLEKPNLTSKEAYDIAAYINTDLPRKHDANIGNYYPNPKFRPGYVVIPQSGDQSKAALKHAKYGPYTNKELQPL